MTDTEKKKLYGSIAVFVLAGAVVLINGFFIFDNVLWGDEAFGATATRNNLFGIMQIVYYLDSHPPLYYLWLKLFVVLFGESGVAFHLASYVPFLASVVLIITLVRKKAGNLAASVLLIFAGLSEPCIKYIVEVRMYELTFFLTLLCCIFSYMAVTDESKIKYWILMVVACILNEYTFYFSIPVCGCILGFTMFACMYLYGRKQFFRGILFIGIMIVAYIPWIPVLIRQAGYEFNWWYSGNKSLRDMIRMILGGDRMESVTSRWIVIILVFVILFELSIVVGGLRNGKPSLVWGKPQIRKLSPDVVSMIVCGVSITVPLLLIWAYSALVSPMLEERYFYPACPVLFFFTAVGIKYISGKLEGKSAKVIAVIFAVWLVGKSLFMGYLNVNDSYVIWKYEKTGTDKVLEVIGTPSPDCVMAADGVRHLTWTVFPYYFPDNEMSSDPIGSIDVSETWFFNGSSVTDEQLSVLSEKGYTVSDYGKQNLGQYDCYLYHLVKTGE